eukprot:4622621-Pleurochrysis_carterae.AAC.1
MPFARSCMPACLPLGPRNCGCFRNECVERTNVWRERANAHDFFVIVGSQSRLMRARAQRVRCACVRVLVFHACALASRASAARAVVSARALGTTSAMLVELRVIAGWRAAVAPWARPLRRRLRRQRLRPPQLPSRDERGGARGALRAGDGRRARLEG